MRRSPFTLDASTFDNTMRSLLSNVKVSKRDWARCRMPSGLSEDDVLAQPARSSGPDPDDPDDPDESRT
jgi:hypothetical protein